MATEQGQWYQESQARLDVAFAIRDRINLVRTVLHDARPEVVEAAIKANEEIPDLLKEWAQLPGTPKRVPG